MISQTKCVIIGLLGTSFILNIRVSHSLPNGEQMEKYGQLDRNEKREDSEEEMIYQINKYMKNLSKSTNSLNERLDGLKTDMTRQISECSKNVDSSDNDLYRRPENLEINVTQWVNSLNRTLDDFSVKIYNQVGEYAAKVAHSESSLKRTLENLNMKFIDQVVEYADNITEIESSLDSRLKNLESEIKQKEISDALRRLPDEIVRYIKSGQFSEAEQKLKQTNDGTYKYAVHEVYNNQVGNFDLILRFGDSIRDLESKFKIYQALHNEMKDNNHRDTSKVLRLCESIQTNILNNSTDFVNAQSLHDASWALIQDDIPNVIADSINKNEHISTIKFGNNNNTCLQCRVDIWQQVIKKLWNKNNLIDICDRAQKYQKNIDAQIAFYLALFRELQQRNSIYTQNAVTLARHMKLQMDSADYQSISAEMKSKFEEIKKMLPLSVKNLVFASVVCLKNTAYNEYLYAKDEKYDSDRREIFTWMPGGIGTEPNRFKWKVHFNDTLQVMLSNFEFNEYIYNECDENLQDRYHYRCYVFINELPTRNATNSEYLWNIEFDESGILFKNQCRRQYLFADRWLNYHNERRSISTSSATSDNCKWDIIDCSDQ